MKSLGLCVGAATLSAVILERRPDGDGNPTWQVIATAVRPHQGNPEAHVRQLLATWKEESFVGVVVTGGSFSQRVNLTRIPEPWAVEQALAFPEMQGERYQAVVALGGEGFLAYPLDRNGQIAGVVTGNKCASGTGEFFLQQIRRLGLSLEAAVSLPWIEDPYPVSGRCSVFCKSDCTHAANKGVEREKIVAGLCRMMASKVTELLVKARIKGPVLLTGGVTRNRLLLEYVQRDHPHLVVAPWATCFEALGAALWGTSHPTLPLPVWEEIITRRARDNSSLLPLARHAAWVEFKELQPQPPRPGDVCILGLDVGSTTTKAVLLRREDHAFLTSIYLRTNGDPIGAARACYQAIQTQLVAALPAGEEVRIVGLGMTGSGRQLAGLHADTQGIINEIVAHATAAAFFDPQVETLFEIGGQDAKYTRLAHGLPIDYAMNEACAAGTGSFLEESAWETLGVPLTEIAAVAMRGERIPEFSDQCAAFIAADINNAIHAGCSREEIVAGLVYAIGVNYLNRVKGQRPVGKRVFMQGGVCYNPAVPLAMAGLLGIPIVVPPEPGLMGALGVALQIDQRLSSGAVSPGDFDLTTLAAKEVTLTRSFYCPGTREACDRHCAIAVFAVDGHRVPFGGACNKYVNARQGERIDRHACDRITWRHDSRVAVSGKVAGISRGRVGLNRSFMLHQFQPLYSQFFAALGWQPILPETCSTSGIERRNAALCHPAELAHGYFHTLLALDDPPEYLFLPHFRAVPAQTGHTFSQVCPIVQAEPFYLQAAFRPELEALQRRGVRLLSPLLDLTNGLEEAAPPLIAMAGEMGIPPPLATAALQKALHQQRTWEENLRREGERLLAELAREPDQIGVILFSRPYGGLTAEANLGIPGKLASRGIRTLSFDMLPATTDAARENMYWGLGQRLLKTARFTARHPQLFGVFVTYFGCGPDSFLLGYFRDIMEQERKPTLFLELDGHTADAGLETRIEAFLDVVDGHRKSSAKALIPGPDQESGSLRPPSLARLHFQRGQAWITTSAGEKIPASDRRVTVLVPWVGLFFTEALTTALRLSGFHAVAHPATDSAVLQQGRAHVSGKECLPLILTTGMLMQHLATRTDPDEILVYFMPTASGPCRFGQYAVFMEDLIKRLAIPNVALLSLTSENSYGGLGTRFSRLTWWGIILADTMEEIRAMLLANARDPQAAMELLHQQWSAILTALATGTLAALERQLATSATTLAAIPLRRPAREVPLIALSGEIYVRRDPFARGHLVERLAERGFATLCTGIAEWVHYSDALVERGQVDYTMSAWEKVVFYLQKKVMARDEQRLRRLLERSGLLLLAPAPVAEIVRIGEKFIASALAGEAILTVGNGLLEIASRVCGVIAIAPFGCLPNRIAEAMMGDALTPANKTAACPGEEHLASLLAETPSLPFLAIETDGAPFPQRIDARLDAFCLQAERLHRRMGASRIN
ncbi:MAG: activase [Magnetococcales bacterium]|nr:activase [Magnetococcales bacterium]